MATSTEQAHISGEKYLAGAHAFSPDGRLLAFAGDGGIVLWDVAAGREAGRLHVEPVRMMALAFSLDGTLLAAAGNDGTVRLWGVP
jgi:WD40 repeat protein